MEHKVETPITIFASESSALKSTALQPPASLVAVAQEPSTLPQTFIFCERDRVAFSGELDAVEIDDPRQLADAVGDSDSPSSLAWGISQAMRTLAEALALARSSAWKDWTEEARSFRWHHAGRTEIGL